MIHKHLNTESIFSSTSSTFTKLDSHWHRGTFITCTFIQRQQLLQNSATGVTEHKLSLVFISLKNSLTSPIQR